MELTCLILIGIFSSVINGQTDTTEDYTVTGIADFTLAIKFNSINTQKEEREKDEERQVEKEYINFFNYYSDAGETDPTGTTYDYYTGTATTDDYFTGETTEATEQYTTTFEPGK